MFHAGLIWKYKVGRPLTEFEVRHRLNQRQRLEVEPADEAALIEINSTYLESLDKYFAEKGWLALVSIAVLIFVVPISALVGSWIYSGLQESGDNIDVWMGVFFLLVFIVPLTVVSVFAFRLEGWRLTHYPIRLNRANRMVYVFRQDKSILSVAWDDVFFTLNKENSRPMLELWEIQGHVLSKDGKTVDETFAFSAVAGHDVLHRHWEFLRRYMEEGPEKLVDRVKDYAPTGKRKEKFWEGFSRLVSDDIVLSPIFAMVFSPFTFLQALARWLVMRTCKIPVWPQEIQKACAVTPDDPWARNADHPTSS